MLLFLIWILSQQYVYPLLASIISCGDLCVDTATFLDGMTWGAIPMSPKAADHSKISLVIPYI